MLAALGAAVVAFFAWRVHDQLTRVGRQEVEKESLFLASYVRDRLNRALERRRASFRGSAQAWRATDPATWADLDPELSESFAGLPYLRSVQISLPGQGTVGFLGLPGDQRRASRPCGPKGEMLVIWDEAPVILVAFPVGDLEEDGQALVNVRARPRTPLAEREQWAGAATAGMIVVGVLIYLLAALAYFAARHQDRLLGHERLRGARLDAVGEVAAGIAHEVRNPLNAIGLLIQFFQKRALKTGKLPTTEEYGRVHAELRRIEKVVSDFVRFARMRAVNPVRLDLKTEVESLVGQLGPRLDERGIRVRLRARGDLHCLADRDRVLEAILAILEDAVRGGRPGELRLDLSGDARTVSLVVGDTREISGAHALEGFFDPDFRSREGAPGLAMTVARTLIESHGGALEVKAGEIEGCMVTVTLPRRFY